jgi:hypothetical protein
MPQAAFRKLIHRPLNKRRQRDNDHTDEAKRQSNNDSELPAA